MTDNEIIKALECCEANEGDSPNCEECPYFGLREKPSDCYKKARKGALSLINRQKAKIERLNDEISDRERSHIDLYNDMRELKDKFETARADAIKEFAERLKAECRQDRYAIQTSTKFGVVDKKYLRVVDENDIDNLVKEMVGDAE